MKINFRRVADGLIVRSVFTADVDALLPVPRIGDTYVHDSDPIVTILYLVKDVQWSYARDGETRVEIYVEVA